MAHFSVFIGILVCSILMKNVIAQKVQLHSVSGQFSSPVSDDSTYPNNLNMTWEVITDQPGQAIAITFKKFDIEDSYEAGKGACVYDYVRITDGKGNLVCKVCGNAETQIFSSVPKLNDAIIIAGPRALIQFVSDYSNDIPIPKGFLAIFEIIDMDECRARQEIHGSSMSDDWEEYLVCSQTCNNVPGSYLCSCEDGFILHENKHSCMDDCGATLLSGNGMISPQLHEGKYAKMTDCEWTIQGEVGHSIKLRFDKKFNIEQHEDEGCVYDWIEYEAYSGFKSERLCGQEAPNNGLWIDTFSPTLVLRFHTDISTEESGFKLYYDEEEPDITCDALAPSGDPNLVITPHVVANPKYNDKIQFNCINNGKLIGKAVITCGVNGKWDAFPPHCEVKHCRQPDHLHLLEDATVYLPDGGVVETTVGSIVTVVCYKWYELIDGADQWICGEDEKWHPYGNYTKNNLHDLPQCKIITGLKGTTAILSGKYDFGKVVQRDNVDIEPAFGPKIISGKPARRAEWPWMALFDIYDDGFKQGTKPKTCGGSLISQSVILTAAHCFATEITPISYYVATTKVYLGLHDIYNTTSSNVQKLSLKSIHKHKEFDYDTFENDIALVFLHSAKIGFWVRPIRLPLSQKHRELPMRGLRKEKGYEEEGVVTGWGYKEENSGSISRFLMEVKLKAKTHENCKRDYYPTLLKTMLCAGSGKKDSCTGDSGGPFTYRDTSNGRWYLNGIVSFGSLTRTCGRPNTVGIYTNVGNYIDWISKALINKN